MISNDVTPSGRTPQSSPSIGLVDLEFGKSGSGHRIFIGPVKARAGEEFAPFDPPESHISVRRAGGLPGDQLPAHCRVDQEHRDDHCAFDDVDKIDRQIEKVQPVLNAA
jgi:hypothetical protein